MDWVTEEEEEKKLRDRNAVKSLLHEKHKGIKFKVLCCQGQLGQRQLLRKAVFTQSLGIQQNAKWTLRVCFIGDNEKNFSGKFECLTFFFFGGGLQKKEVGKLEPTAYLKNSSILNSHSNCCEQLNPAAYAPLLWAHLLCLILHIQYALCFEKKKKKTSLRAEFICLFWPQ